MQFAHPELLWLLVVVAPAATAFFWWSSRKRRALLTQFIHARLLPGLLAGVSEQRQRFRYACLTLAICLAIIALARPQWGFTWEEVRQRGLDIVVAIDTSKSMLARDVEPNRLARAKLAALDLMQRARTDRLGLVAFAGSAFLQCPLTIDDSVFRQSVESLDVRSISRGGTAISQAIETAMSAFTEAENYKVLVLLTDGEDHDSNALEATRQAAAKGLEIFTIGIGTPQGEMVRVKDASGQEDFVRDEQGNVVKSRLNERILQEIAGATQRGFYLPLRGAKAIDALYEKGLAPMPKSESGEKFVKRFHERFQWPLGAAILLLIVEMLFPERKRAKPTAPRSGNNLSTKAAIALLLGFAAVNVCASAGSAARAYESGEYARALKEYKELLQKTPGDARLHFNAGNAAYKNRQLEEAASQFNEALASRDLQLQQKAFYNRGNTFFALGDASADPQLKSEAWQKSIRDFESALKLDPQDKDAGFNRDFVKRKLEELEKQQQQQKQDDKDDQKGEDKQNQQDQQPQQGEQDKEQQQQQQQDQNKQDQKQDQQRQQQDQKDQQQDQKQGQEEKQQQPDKKEQQQRPEEQKERQSNEQQSASAAPGQMTPEQARQLLDAQKGEEKILQFRPEEKPADDSRPIRDW